MEKNSKDLNAAACEGDSDNGTPAVSPSDFKQIITIPNILTFMRIILIIPFVIAFFNEEYITASLMLVMSGLSDCFDGLIARKLNQITALGKILDPIADKLTLLAVAICICFMTPQVIPVMVLLVVKDVAMIIGGIILIRAGKTPPAAKWYGKSGTLMFYISVCTIVFLKAVYTIENTILNIILMSLTSAMMIFALCKYYLIFRKLMKDGDDNKE